MHSLSIFSSINWKPKILPNIFPKHTSVYNSHLHAILWSQSLKQTRTNFLISTFSFFTKLLMYVDSVIFSLIAIVLEWIFPEHVQQFFQYLLLFIKWINKGNAKALLNLPAPWEVSQFIPYYTSIYPFAGFSIYTTTRNLSLSKCMPRPQLRNFAVHQ